MSKQVGILGEGAWGTAIATVLARNGYIVKLWCYHASVAEQITKTGINEQFLPGIKLSKSIIPVTRIEDVVCGSELIFEAIPVKYLRDVITKARNCFTDAQTWIVLSKGIENKTLLLPSQIIDDVFQKKVKQAIVAGPSFAMDVAKEQITAVALASSDCAIAQHIQSVLANNYFRPYITTDTIGVQIGAALKNVITLAIGMLDGAGYTDNTKAFIFTRGLHEISTLIPVLGGKQETAYGLSGIGDVVLSAFGKLSKNLEVGKRLGHREKLDTILQETGYIPEGINTVQSLHELLQIKMLDLPICQGVYEIIFKDVPIASFLKKLMNKPLTFECEMSK